MHGRTVTALMCGSLIAGLTLQPAAARAANNAQVAGSTIPTAMSPGYTYDVAVTMRNTGTTTWIDNGGYNLGDQGSAPLVVPGRISASGGSGVAPGGEHTFRFSIRTPLAAGTYATSWRMVQENVEWFGEIHTRNVAVSYGSSVPTTPVITWPPSGATAGSNRPDITWAAVPHDAYEVHICLQNDPSATQGGWDSGVVWISEVTTTAMSGPLATQAWHHAFVRLHNPNGWSAWSTGRLFYVAGRLLNEPYWVGDSVGGQWPHTICHNPDRNEYLVAFADAKPGLQSRISYYVLNSVGERISSEFTITDDDHLDGVHEAAVAYDSGSAEYLITYTGWMLDGTSDLHDQLRGQKVDSQTGALKGASYLLYDSGGAMYEFRMAYSPTSDVYLAVWKDGTGNMEVFATRVSGSTGQRVGPIINLTAHEDRYSAYPLVAWNSARDEFLVVYQVDASALNQGWNYYAGRIAATNGETNPSFQISDWPGSESAGGLAYDADLDRYLMVYEAHESGVAISGQFLTSAGEVSGARFPVLESPYSGGSVWLTWHPNTREFLAGWLDCCSYGDYGRRISQVGVPLGERFKITGNVFGIGNWKPVPVANTVSNDYLFAWFNSYNDVWTRRYQTLPMLDVTPPAPVTQFTAMPSHGQITLSWTNPTTSDFLGTIIRYKTAGYPTGPHDGLPLAVRPKSPGSSDSFVHTGLNRATTYYYAAFAYDAIPNHAPAALASARPPAPADFNGDNDVDQADFGHLQNCFGGSGQPTPTGCNDADLDGDGDVDPDDWGVFIGCMSGANQPPGC